jgi:hypothetical protein
VSFPLSLFAYPFYLLNRSPGKVGSHFDPKCDLFTQGEGKMVSVCFVSGICLQPQSCKCVSRCITWQQGLAR